ncbi:MAG: DUF2127 domain-containing protein [Candidatus Dormibacteria bacterium]
MTWARWELGRRIEVTPAIRLITVERFVKGAVLLVGGLALLVVSNHGDTVPRIAGDLQNELNLSPGRGVLRQVYATTIIRFGNYSRLHEDAVAAGAMLYGALEVFEGVGLLLRRRWAEYLVLVATAAFLPLEIGELLHSATPLKAAALILNIVIILYLVWRKRLFLERPGQHVVADDTVPAPG